MLLSETKLKGQGVLRGGGKGWPCYWVGGC